MYKAVFVFLLLASNATLAFSYIPNNSIKITNNNISLPNKKGIMRPLRTPSSPYSPASPASPYTLRTPSSPSSPVADITSPYLDRSVLGLLLSVIPTIPLKYIIARPAKFTRTHEASPDDIIELAAMATLGTLGITPATPATPATLDDEANYTDINNTVSTKTKAKIDAIIKDIMSNCKRNGKNAPEVSISNIQRYCSPSNIIKNKNTKALSLSFKKCKYALLFGEFSEYEIIEYARAAVAADSHNTYYVSLKVSAPYKTMLRNGIQFTDMYYPKTRDYNNICFVMYKLSLKKYEDGNLYIEAGTIVPPRTQF
jgi:hypothetical protein